MLFNSHFERNFPHRNNTPNTERKSFNADIDRPWVFRKTPSSYVSMNVTDQNEDAVECKIQNGFAGDALLHIVLDTGCPQNVAGRVQAKCFLDSLNEKEFSQVKKSPCQSKFKFSGESI